MFLQNKKKRPRGNTDRITQIETTIRENQYKSKLENDDLFYFGDKTLGDGTQKHHLNIMMTSKSMMSKCEYHGVFHIDGTYKLIKKKILSYGQEIIIKTVFKPSICIFSLIFLVLPISISVLKDLNWFGLRHWHLEQI